MAHFKRKYFLTSDRNFDGRSASTDIKYGPACSRTEKKKRPETDKKAKLDPTRLKKKKQDTSVKKAKLDASRLKKKKQDTSVKKAKLDTTRLKKKKQNASVKKKNQDEAVKRKRQRAGSHHVIEKAKQAGTSIIKRKKRAASEKKKKQLFATETQKPIVDSQKSELLPVDEELKWANVVKKGNHWQESEEMILIGVVYDHLFLYGSLTQDGWSNILDKFRRSWKEFYRLNGKQAPDTHRSDVALSRHYKIMKQRCSNEMKQGLFKVYFRTWDENFGHLFVNERRNLDHLQLY